MADDGDKKEYKIVHRPSAERDIRKLNKTNRQQLESIVKKIRALKTNPRPVGVEQLTNEEAYRIRDGDYRIIYEIDDSIKLITISRIRHRREVYRKK
ncbi:MAG: type II toxin-antitoxin system RelE/ParE family toxin [Thermoguttaceae bacterium]